MAPNDDKAFEQLCQHVMEHQCKTLWGQAYARNGYAQHGVDFYIEVPNVRGKDDNASTLFIGVQCKHKDRFLRHELTVDELNAEVEKAKGFRPVLTDFILATSAPTTKAVQDRANELTGEQQRHTPSSFRVRVWFWEKIRHEFGKDERLLQEIAQRFYPHLRTAFLPPKSRHQLPPLPGNTVPRPSLMAEIEAAFAVKRPNGVIRAVALVADGGFGKSIAALQYANLPHNTDVSETGRYPGGRFLIRCEHGSIVGELVGLAVQLGVPQRPNAEDTANEVKRSLETGRRCLLILDNVVDSDQWAADAFRSLIPTGQADVLLTTRARQLADVTEVKVAALTIHQSVDVLTTFRGDAGSEMNRPSAESLVTEVEGLAVAVAAIGAYMKLTPKATWEGFASALRKGSASLMHESDQRVSSHLGYERSVVEVLDAAINALPAAHRRAMEYAALLPADMVPASWLTALLEADAEMKLIPRACPRSGSGQWGAGSKGARKSGTTTEKRCHARNRVVMMLLP
ncbi:MAG: NB-ARC domain-containing protein, partial [Limisphaerales bacterium]